MVTVSESNITHWARSGSLQPASGFLITTTNQSVMTFDAHIEPEPYSIFTFLFFLCLSHTVIQSNLPSEIRFSSSSSSIQNKSAVFEVEQSIKLVKK